MNHTKKLGMLLAFTVMLLPARYSSVHAQIPTVDALSNKKLAQELLKWVKDYAKQNQQDGRMAKILGENTAAGEKLEKLLELKQQVEKDLYLAKDFRKLRFSDLGKIRAEVYGLASTDAYVTEVPYVREFVSIINQTASVRNSQKAYDYLFDGTTAYRPESSGTLNGYVENNKAHKARQYALAIAAQKRKISVAMSYQRLADQYTGLAGDLSEQTGQDNAQKMSTGERIQAQKLANDYLVKSVEMKRKADQLLRESAEKPAVIQQVDHSYQAALMRRQLVKTGLK